MNRNAILFGFASIALVTVAALSRPSTLLAGGSTQPWTTAGTTGTVDEADASLPVFSGAIASVSAAVAAGTLDIRYNVVAIDGLLNTADADFIEVRYQDNGASARVIVRLKSYDCHTGATATLQTFDSNAFGQMAGLQCQRVVGPCFFPRTYDFVNKVYFIEAQLIKTAADGAPALGQIRIGTLLC